MMHPNATPRLPPNPESHPPESKVCPSAESQPESQPPESHDNAHTPTKMPGTVLACVRHAAFYLAMALWTILFAPLILVVLVLPQRCAFFMGTLFCRGLVCFMAWFLGLRHRISGQEHLPQGPFILASKHQSIWETLVFVTILPNPAFVLKAELMAIPLVGGLLRKMDMIPVSRGRDKKRIAPASSGATASQASVAPSKGPSSAPASALSLPPITASSLVAKEDPRVCIPTDTSSLASSTTPAPTPLTPGSSSRSPSPASAVFLQSAHKAVHDQHRSIIIFPEGTRTHPGAPTRYRQGVVILAKHLQRPVVPVALNSGLFWPKGFFKKPGTIDVVFLPPLCPTLPSEILLERLKDHIETASGALL